MRRMLVALILLSAGILGTAAADLNDLSGGVLIAHYPSELLLTEEPPSGWCQHYLSHHAIASCESQVNRIDTCQCSVWFVLAAWTEDKEWRGLDFGLGEYSIEDYLIVDHGACFPSMGLTIPTPNWPGPSEGISLAVTDSAWAGNFIPLYYFRGYSYGQQVVPLAVNPSTQSAAAANSLNPPVAYEFTDLGAMGMRTEGTAVCPGGLVGFADYIEVGVGVCCSDERCVPVAEPGCTGLGEEWEYHPEWTSCDPNPCMRLIAGSCSFPCDIRIAPGKILRFEMHDFQAEYVGGEIVTIDWEDGQLTLNGQPWLPPAPAPPLEYSVEFLREHFGAVPMVQHLLASQSHADWNRAVRIYLRTCHRLLRNLASHYSSRISRGESPREAALALCENLSESELIDSADILRADAHTRQCLLNVNWHGREAELHQLVYGPPGKNGDRSYVDHRKACDRLEALKLLESEGGTRMIKIGPGGWTFSS